MTRIGKILVATDFSPAANNAMSYAVQLAEQTDQDMVVMYVHKEEESDQDIRNRFEQIEHDFMYGRGFQCLFDTRVGSVITAIQDAVREYDIDIMIIGTRGFEGVKEMQIGSLTADLLDNPVFPVISIPKYCRNLDFNHIVLASDFNEIDQNGALRMVYELASQCESDLKIVHVKTGGSEPTSPKARYQLDTIFSVVPHVYYELEGKSVVDSLLQFCENEPVDLLVTLRKKFKDTDKLLSGSISKQLSLRGKVPLMVIPSKN